MKLQLSEEVIDTINFHASASYDAIVEHLKPVFDMAPADMLGQFPPQTMATMNAISHVVIATANIASEKGAMRDEIIAALGRAVRVIIDNNSRGGDSAPVFAAFNRGFDSSETITVEDMTSDTTGTQN
jgi:hypothetical protein